MQQDVGCTRNQTDATNKACKLIIIIFLIFGLKAVVLTVLVQAFYKRWGKRRRHLSVHLDVHFVIEIKGTLAPQWRLRWGSSTDEFVEIKAFIA